MKLVGLNRYWGPKPGKQQIPYPSLYMLLKLAIKACSQLFALNLGR